MKMQVSSLRLKIIIISLLISLLHIIWGCVTPHSRSFTTPMPEEIRKQVRSVTVVPSTSVPTINFMAFKSQMSTAEQLLLIKDIAKSAATCPPCAVIILVFFAVAYQIQDTINAVPIDDAKKMEALINGAIAELSVQDNLARQLVAAGSALTSYKFSFSEEGKKEDRKPAANLPGGEQADMIINLNVQILGFSGGKGPDPAISFYMIVAARAVRTADGAEIYADNVSHVSNPHKVSEWAHGGAALLLQEIKNTYTILAEKVLENIFFVQDFHVDSMWSGAEHCMLKPYNPPLIGIDFVNHKVKASKVDSLQPAFKWEAFPRDKDRKSDAAGMLARISDITYDLKIWKGHKGYPDELIYEKRGIPAPERVIENAETQMATGASAQAPIVRKERIPEHTIETPLEPSTEYFWTVRARFKLDGQNRVTRWSYSRLPWQPGPDPCLSQGIPVTHYFRFITPE